MHRLGKFVAVGWVGFAIQLTALAVLMSLAHWAWLPATIAAVELAVINNFFWHERITWRDRMAAPDAASRAQRIDMLKRFLRFNGATGLTSIFGNALLMAIYVGVIGLPALLANVVAVATMSVANFVVADRWVFRAGRAGRAGGERLRPHRAEDERIRGEVSASARGGGGAPPPLKNVAPPRLKKSWAVAFVAFCTFSTAASAAPPSTAVAAWDQYVAQTEKRLDPTRHAAWPAESTAAIPAEGNSIGVDGGTISEWRGSVFIAHVTLDDVLSRLQYPGTAPPQDDVLSSHVMSRGPNSVHVFIRLVRHAIVTVTYDTEHEMTFKRRTPTVATARSVATRIQEVGDSDRGFLWRLNSYWRYEQVNGGVWVDLQSLTLSRTVPAVVRPIASPIVSRIARESTVRTLEALRRYLGSKATQS